MNFQMTKDELTRVSGIAFEFDWDVYDERDYEENRDPCNFHSNVNDYVEKIIAEYDEIRGYSAKRKLGYKLDLR